jgi:hypothetical protein
MAISHLVAATGFLSPAIFREQQWQQQQNTQLST